MSYQVLARKWRPRTFAELVGQEHTVRALTNALDRQRLHHAFLFTGTRGVGKTTIARIFAKSLNCEQGITSTPCGECAACREIDAGRFVDLVEVDAASRTKVEDTRDLLENVQYAPSRGRFKVYLIDEVHMLSGHSFNALLKTLEEPPPHVKFLLATTDPQKLPVTVLSRCLQFGLKRLPATLITAYLGQVLTQENIPYEEAALRLIARAGDGSMRDALSLLDQAIAFGGGRVEQTTVASMLGTIDRRWAVDLLAALANNDAQALLQRVAQINELAPDYAAILAELLSLLQQIALAQMVPEAPLDSDLADPEDVMRLAQAVPPEDVQLFYQIALLGRRDLPLVPEPRGGFEMVLLRMLCFRPTTPAASGSGSHDSAHQGLPPKPSAIAAPTPPLVPSTSTPVAPVSRPNTPSVSEWGLLVENLGLGGLAKQLALNCLLIARDGNDFLLGLVPAHAQMLTKAIQDRVKVALEQHLGAPVNLRFQIGELTAATPEDERKQRRAEQVQAAVEAAHRDPNVQAMIEMFDAKIVGVRPLDND